MDVTASVQARMGSSRLPGKVLLPLGEKRVIERVIDHCRAAKTVDRVVLTTGQGSENDAIREWCEREGVPHMTGEESDLLGRHLAVATETSCDLLVRITGDCPFLPPDEIDRLVQSHGNNEYTTNYTDRMPVGTDIDVLTTDVLKRLRERGEDHPVIELRSNPEEWEVTITENDGLLKYSDVDVAVDTPADYWRLFDATEAVGAEPATVIEWLANEN